MPISIPTALLVGGVASAGAGVAGSAIASSEQAGAAKNAQELQAQEAQNALNFQEKEFNTQQANEQPFLQAGQGAVSTLAGMLPGLTSPVVSGPFTAPTAAQAEAQPGYQFALGQGEQAIQNSAAARGGLLSGGTAKALDQYATGAAETNYQNVYNNALQAYNTNYNVAANQQANTFNRYAALAGLGQTSAQQLGQTGQAAAGNIGNIDLTSGAQQGADINLGGAATASGYVGGANAISAATGNLGQYALLQQLMSLNGGNAGPATGVPGVLQ